jgi:hypothetical protein
MFFVWSVVGCILYFRWTNCFSNPASCHKCFRPLTQVHKASMGFMTYPIMPLYCLFLMQSHSWVHAGLHMALSRFCHSMLWQLAAIVLLLVTVTDRAYAKKYIPQCFKGCLPNEKGKGVCRNRKNDIIACRRTLKKKTFLG